MKASARNDGLIKKLIDDVQAYSNPTGKNPSPPRDASPERRPFVEPAPADEAGPDRLQPPDWFQPTQHAGDRTSEEVPAVSDEIALPDFSPAEEETINATGVEALAFYAPFHFYQRHQWGIYIRDFGLAYLASRFLRRMTLTPTDNWVLRCAHEFLLQHEYFHRQTEIAVTRYEILLFQGTMYLDHAYLHHLLDRHSSWIEESVANARAYREFGRKLHGAAPASQIDAFKVFLAGWMKTQPPGYRDYDRWGARLGLKKGHAAITTHFHRSLAHWRREAIESDADVLNLFREAEYSRVPVVRVPDARLTGFRLAREFPKAHGVMVRVYSNDHHPPHMHVDFLDGGAPVRVEWPTLSPLETERALSGKERKKLIHYVRLHQPEILRKLRSVYVDPTLPAAIQ